MIITDLKNSKLIVVFDFSCLAYRAFHSKQEDKISFIFKRVCYHLNRFVGCDISIVFALDGDFLSKKITNPEYKANRKSIDPSPKDIYLDVFKLFNCTIIKNQSEEADDIICTFIKNNTDKPVVVITSDSDLCHLNTIDNVSVVNERSGEDFTKEKIFKKNSISLDYEHLVLFKTTFGDSSDNIKPVLKNLNKRKLIPILTSYYNDSNKYFEKASDYISKIYGLSEKDRLDILVKFHNNYSLIKPRFDLEINESTELNYLEDVSSLLDPSLINCLISTLCEKPYRRRLL